jgi:hypothetical protein
VQALYRRVESYLDRMSALGLTDRDLARPMGPLSRAGHVVRQLLLGLLWLPLAAPGMIIHAPIGLLIGWAGSRFTPRKDVIATTKLILGLALLPLAYGAILVAIGWRFGLAAAALTFAGGLLSGWATLRVLERGAKLGQLLAASFRVLALRTEVAALRAERALLEAEVVRAVDRFRPSDMVPLFPRAIAPAPPSAE